MFFALIALLGISVMAYPFLGDMLSRYNAMKEIEGYEQIVEEKDSSEVDALFAAAYKYNDSLLRLAKKDHTENYHNTKEYEDYKKLLSITSTGILGELDIEKIGEQLPIYHGTEEAVLATGVGHLYQTSLPVEGESVHSIIAGHTGLPNAQLLTNLDEMTEGDEFSIRILNRRYYYKVNQIKVVLPEETDDVQIEPGKNYVTLLTCTPYGVNSHRLLVRGELSDVKIENKAVKHPVFKNIKISKYEKAFVSIALIAVVLVIVFITAALMMSRKRSKKNKKQK